MLGEAGLSVVSGAALFIVISRVAGTEKLGVYALSLAWLMLFQGLGSFGIPEFIMREVGGYDREAAAEVTRALLLGLCTALVSAGLMLSLVRSFGYPDQVVRSISVASLAVIPAFINSGCRAVFLAVRRMHITFLTLLVESTIVMAVSLYLVLSGYGAVALLGTLVVAKTISATIALTMLHRRVLPLRFAFDLRLLVRTGRTVMTFGLGFTLGVLTMRLNTIMASVWVGIVSVGHYAAATKVTEMCMILPSLISQLLMTRMAHSFNTQVSRDPNQFGAWFELLFALVISTCVGVWVFAGTILPLLFGPGFEEATWVLRILMFYVLIETTDAKMSLILKAAGRQGQDLARLAFNPLINIALGFMLLPFLGITGAAIGRVGGVAVSATLRYRLIAQDMIQVQWVRFAIRPALISVAVGAVCFALSTVYPPIWLMPVYVVATALSMRGAPGVSSATIKDMMSRPSAQE